MRKLVLLFVLAVGLFGCSESQDPFVEENALKETSKEILLAVEEILLKEKNRDKDILFTKAAEGGGDCSGLENTMAALRREMRVMTDRMQEETDKLIRDPGEPKVTPEEAAEVARIIRPILYTYRVYQRQYNNVAAIHEMCTCL